MFVTASQYSSGLLVLLAATPFVWTNDGPIRFGRGPHLCIDEHLIASSNMARRIAEPDRLPYPVVTGVEDKCFQSYMTLLRDPVSSRFHMWYGVPV